MKRLSILLTVMAVMVGAPFFFFVNEALAAVLTGTAANDTLVGTDSSDELKGRAGDDYLDGGGGDTIEGAAASPPTAPSPGVASSGRSAVSS